MDNLNLNKHISGQFNAELESIRTQVMTMGMVEQQLSDAITAMHNQDSELAKRVIEGDKNVNMMEVAIDGLRAHYRETSADGERPASGDGDHQNHRRAGTYW
jgi:Na+/phosphate symporter